MSDPLLDSMPGIPPDIITALQSNGRCHMVFMGLVPAEQQRYVLWITSAKREDTRQRRIRTVIRMILEWHGA